MAEPSPLDADWDALTPEKKAQLQALVTKLDMAKDYKGGEGAMGAGGEEGQRAYYGIASQGGLPKEQLAALARFRAYNLNQASDPNWQGPPQAPITGPIAPAIVVRPRDQLNEPIPPGTVTRTGMTKAQAARSDTDNRYAMLAKPEQRPAQAPLRVPPLDRAAPVENASIPDVPDDAPEHNKIGAGFLRLLQSLGIGK